ncbi:MAG: OB-fold nucleic acid binding domain-containing protein [Candidatus Methanofastidiosia archaeon]|jgi:aspartyl/asparaginyl-tRNA synthetase
MKDKGIIAGALVCILAGMVVLCTVVLWTQPVKTEIAHISVHESGKYVACEGIVYSVNTKGEHCFVKIFDGCSVDVPLFEFTGDISVGDLLYVEGVVSVYNGELEIIPEKFCIFEVLYGECADSVLYTEQGAFDVSLDNGIHGVTGTIIESTLKVEKDLSLEWVTEVKGKVYQSGETFQVFGNPFRYVWTESVQLGEISGIGIQDNGYVYMVYYTWNPLPVYTIAEAVQSPKGYPVTITGTVTAIHYSQGHIFLTVSDFTDCILIPVFKNQQSNLNVDINTFYTGQTITVTGVIDVYKGCIEILPEVITV